MTKARGRDPEAAKLKRLSAKVAAHKAQNAGMLRSAFDELSRAVKTLVEVDVFGDKGLENEIKIIQEVTKRFRARVKTHQQAKAGGLAMALAALERTNKLLDQAEGQGGYKLAQLRERARIDTARLKQLRDSLQFRSREAAFVLAELEQAADPFPGLQLATAAARKRHDDARKKKLKAEGPEAQQVLVAHPPDDIEATDRPQTS